MQALQVCEERILQNIIIRNDVSRQTTSRTSQPSGGAGEHTQITSAEKRQGSFVSFISHSDEEIFLSCYYFLFAFYLACGIFQNFIVT